MAVMKALFMWMMVLVAGAISPHPASCLTEEEQRLFELINDYRQSRNLSAIPLSASLSRVARLHVHDLAAHYTLNERCNLHSWSDKGSWKPCCYTDDHKAANCMWSKPRELTTYKADGFEIAHFSSGGATAAQALASWKNSKGHHEVIVNEGIWKEITWKAIGIGIYDKYAVVWFGADPDTQPCR